MKGPGKPRLAINNQLGSTDRCRTPSDGPGNLRLDLTDAQQPPCLLICNPVSVPACRCQPSYVLQDKRLLPERWLPFSSLSRQLLRWPPIPLLRQTQRVSLKRPHPAQAEMVAPTLTLRQLYVVRNRWKASAWYRTSARSRLAHTGQHSKPAGPDLCAH